MLSKLFSIITAPFRAILSILATILHFITNLIKAPFSFVAYIFNLPKQIFNRLFRKNDVPSFDYIQQEKESDSSSTRNVLSHVTDIPKNILGILSNFNIFKNRNK